MDFQDESLPGTGRRRHQPPCYACVTHVPMLVTFPSYVKTICLGEAQAPGQLNLRDLAPRWDPYHPVVGGSAGTFALRAYILAHEPRARQVGICQYRKFMTRYRIGAPAVNYQVMDVIPRENIRREVIDDAMLPQGHNGRGDGGGEGGGRDFLIVRPGQFVLNGINYDYLHQYKDVHHVQDLLRFTAMAVELGVLDKSEAGPFLQEKVFLGCGIELGVFPAEFWLPAVGAMEEVTWACVHRYHDTRREGAQRRLWAYCLERLGSYLLLRHLRALHGGVAWIEMFGGYLNLITDGDSAEYVAGI
jgi:hypothetical protein